MTATAVLSPSSVVMRAARGSDGDALARLAALDSKRAPRGEFLVAEVDGAIHAAIGLDDGLASPTRSTRPPASSRCSSCAPAPSPPRAGAPAAAWPSGSGSAPRRARGPREQHHHSSPSRPGRRVR